MSAYLEGFLALLTWGMGAQDLAALVLRWGVGVPFFISGMNKLFCPICHGWLISNLTRSKIPYPQYSCWWVAGWEMLAGLLLIVGLFTSAAYFILLIVCIVAFIVSWKRKLDAKKPAHNWDAATEIGFMFDVLLVWMAIVGMSIGPGAFRLDNVFFGALRP